MAITIDRTGITLTNDTGTPASPVGDGTPLNAADRVALLDKIDQLFNGTRAATFTFGTLLQVDGFGTSLFSAGGTGGNVLRVRNTTAGTGNYARIEIGNDSAAGLASFTVGSSTATFGDPSPASGLGINAAGSGGMVLAVTHASATFRIATGSPASTRLTVSATGVVTLAASVAVDCGVLAYNSADDTSVASGTAIDFDTEVYDEGGNFASDTFTAPVAGRYLLAAGVNLSNVSGGAIDMGAIIVPSAGHGLGYFIGLESSVPNGAQRVFSGSVVVSLSASDTVTVKYYGTGAATVRGDVSTGYRLTYFSARRVL